MLLLTEPSTRRCNQDKKWELYFENDSRIKDSPILSLSKALCFTIIVRKKSFSKCTEPEPLQSIRKKFSSNSTTDIFSFAQLNSGLHLHCVGHTMFSGVGG